MYDDLCPIAIEAKSFTTTEECYGEAEGIGKYGMRIVLQTYFENIKKKISEY